MSTRMSKCTCGAVLAAFMLTFGTAAPARASWPDGTLAATEDDGASNTSRLVTYGLLGAVVVVLFWVGLLGFKMFGPWENNITDAQYREHMPQVIKGEYVHPR